MKRILLLFLVLLLGSALLPQTGMILAQENTLTIALSNDGATLDPHRATLAASMRLIENMYSTLVRYKEGTYGEVEPDLAESYTICPDGRTYTFHLRKGVFFHHSHREVTAEDVKYSIQRIIEKEIRAYQFETIQEMELVDSHTLVITLEEPMAPFLIYLAYPMNAIVNRDVVEKNQGNLDTADAGSGPFQKLEWRRDQHFILEKNPNYYLPDRPFLDRVIFRPIPDLTARTTALRNQEIDMILDVTPQEAMILEQAPGLTVESVPGTFWEYIGLNTETEYFQDVRVRQAVAHAIDREIINIVVKLGYATTLEGCMIPPGHWAYADLALYPERDVQRAKELLEEAGLPQGFKTQLKVGSDFKYQVDAAQIIKQQLLEVGIDVEILAQESSIFFDALGHGDFEMTVVGWLGFVDPDEFLYNIFHSTGMWNQQAYKSTQVDALLERGRLASQLEERARIYGEAQKIIAHQAPMVFLYMNERIAAYLDRVTGFDVHPTITTLSVRETQVVD